MGQDAEEIAVRIIRIHGALDYSNTAKLNRDIEDAAKASPKGFVIDLLEVHYIDSIGIASIVWAHKQVSVTGGRLAIAASPHVRRIIELILPQPLPNLFVCEDLESARRIVGEDPELDA